MACWPVHELIFTDTTDPTRTHVKAMKLLEEAGIHVFIVSITVYQEDRGLHDRGRQRQLC
jgi:hypothetical protein